MKRSFLAGVLMLALLLTGCGAKTTDLMKGVKAQEVTSEPAPESVQDAGEAITGFGVELLKRSLSEGNALVSPVSVLCALAMTANGAKGETLAQMEAVLGLQVDDLNAYLHAWLAQLSQEDAALHLANSIWFTDGAHFTVEQDFLQANADYYGAGIYQAPFDAATLKAINGWVKENTDGMIPEIVDEIPAEAVMYLVNALAFDAEWREIYNEHQVRPGVFTTEDGETQEAELMHSEENAYLEDGLATGFLKYYAGGRYAFAALLPGEGVSVEEYAASLTGEGLQELLSKPRQVPVFAALPKFETEYDAELREVLSHMGMADAFDMAAADFSGLGSSTQGNICIGRVLHKTFLAVNERGTQAGAATAVEMVTESAPAYEEEPKTVVLDRPFVYLLIDCETNLPLFLGTVMEIG